MAVDAAATMKGRRMRRPFRWWALLPIGACLAMALPFGAAQAGSAISDASVRSTLSSMERAAQRQDLSGIEAHLAPRLSAKISTTVGADTQQASFDRRGMLDAIGQGWTLTQDYSFERQVKRIEIAPGGESARVKALMTERVVIGGQAFLSQANETLVFDLIDGEPMLRGYAAGVRVTPR